MNSYMLRSSIPSDAVAEMDDDVTKRRANRMTATTTPRPLHKFIIGHVVGCDGYGSL